MTAAVAPRPRSCPTPAPVLGPARSDDAAAIVGLLAAARGACLPLSRAEVRARLAEFVVARDPRGRVLGCAALRREGAQAELRCLAVSPAARGLGLGRALVALIRERAAGRALFCVSRTPAFFEALGFRRLPAAAVPPRPGLAPGGSPRVALIHPATCPER
ncbi:MAG: GNAT family N-acetyltransferase [Planctomycetota bacterium]